VGAIALLLSTVGIVCCVAAIAGIWMLHQTVREKVENVAVRLDCGLLRASTANQNVQRALGPARASVDQVSKDSAALSGSDEKSRRATSALGKLVRRQVGPNINDLDVRLATLSDAATAISSLLGSFQEFPPFATGRLKSDKMEGWTDQAAQLATTLRRLEAVVGDGNKESSGREIADASTAVENTLQRCQAKVDDWQSELENARGEFRDAKTTLLGWLTSAAIVVTLVAVWVAVGQISLFAHVLPWLRGACPQTRVQAGATT
jgi:hypothetical protein